MSPKVWKSGESTTGSFFQQAPVETEQIFPYSSVTTLATMTKDWSAYVVEIGVAYKEDADRGTTIKIEEELQQDPQIAKKF